MKVKPIENGHVQSEPLAPDTEQPAEKPATPTTMEVEQNDDGSITFFLEDGQECVFREPTGEDITRIESFVLQRQQRGEGTGINALIYKATEILCIKHGDRYVQEGDKQRPGITYKQLTSTPLSKLIANQRRYKAALDFFRFFDSVAQLGQLYGS